MKWVVVAMVMCSGGGCAEGDVAKMHAWVKRPIMEFDTKEECVAYGRRTLFLWLIKAKRRRAYEGTPLHPEHRVECAPGYTL